MGKNLRDKLDREVEDGIYDQVRNAPVYNYDSLDIDKIEQYLNDLWQK